jgi:asparagine synthase (glutamine-hydrolysing)
MKVRRQGDRFEQQQQEYYRVSVEPQEGLSYEESEEELGRILEEAVEKHLIGDVEAGLMLSGGVDSSLLGLLMKRSVKTRLTTYAISDGEGHADIKQARKIAALIGSDHREIRPSFEEFIKAIPHCVRTAEQPASLLGLPIFLLCRQASEKHKLCLNGEGADELFGGYPQYLTGRKTIAGLRSGLERARQIGLAPGPGVIEIADSLSAARTPDEYLTRFFPMYLQDQLVRLHLDVVDKFSMAFGIELRVPFLDNNVIDFASRLPPGFKANSELHVGKYILKKLALRLSGPVMADAVMRNKAGFPSAVAGYSSRFTELCGVALPDEYVRTHEWAPYFASDRRASIDAPVKRNLLLFDLFCFIFTEQRGTVPQGFDMVEFIGARSSRMVSAAW